MIGHAVAAALPELRQHAESLMVTGCKLERLDGSTIDPDNGRRVEVWAQVWSGLCKVATAREAREITQGGQRVTIKPTIVSIPVTAPAARVGDRFATGRGVFWVTSIEHHSLPIQKRYACAENQEVPGD